MNVSLAETQISIGGVERVKERKEEEEGGTAAALGQDKEKQCDKVLLLLCRKLKPKKHFAARAVICRVKGSDPYP